MKPIEIAQGTNDDIIIPMPLNKKQQMEASLQLAEARQKARQEMTEHDMFMFKLLQLKFRLEDYINKESFIEIPVSHS